MYVCGYVNVHVCGCVCEHDITKTPDRNDLKLGTVVVLDSLSESVDFGFKRSRVGVRVRVRVKVRVMASTQDESAPICISRVCTYLHVVVILSSGQAGAGQWLSMDSEIIMKSGEPIGTQGPTGHYVLLDAHFELPSGTIRRRPVSSTHTESIPGQTSTGALAS